MEGIPSVALHYTILARLDPQKHECVLIHYICHYVLHCPCTVLFDCTTLITQSFWPGLGYLHLRT